MMNRKKDGFEASRTATGNSKANDPDALDALGGLKGLRGLDRVNGIFMLLLLAGWMLAMSVAGVAAISRNPDWQREFGIAKCTLLTTGRNNFMVLEPGYQLLLEGGGAKLQVTVLDQTELIDGVLTRVVEEREWKGGQLHEVARNYFAVCEQSKDIFYFGEDADFYENGKVVKHDGSWRAGNGNKPGLMMAGAPRPKMRYYQKLAPRVAMDRIEILSMNEICNTPSGTFFHCMKTKESSALELGQRKYKYYSPGIGFVGDGHLQLTWYGYLEKK